jgi:hypothetical protein
MIVSPTEGFRAGTVSRKVPVEMVPILSTIFVLNRYFLKRADLNRKKPAHLAAFL